MQSDELTLVMDALDIAPQDRARVAARLEAVGGVVGLWRAGVEALQLDQPWVGRRWRAIVALWRCANRPARDAVEVDGPEALIAVLDPFLSLSAAESFHAVFLDGRGRFLGVEEVGRGSVDACLVHPREVFAPAIRARAASVAVVHNHPSGDPAPSRADQALTDRLAAAGHLLGIPLVDHLVIGRGEHCSLVPEPPLDRMATPEHACDRHRYAPVSGLHSDRPAGDGL